MFRFFFSFDSDWFFQFAIYFTCYNSAFNRNNCNLDIYVYMASTDFNLGKKKVIRHTSYGKQHSRNSRNAESRYLIFFGYTSAQLWRIKIGQGPRSFRHPLVSYYLCLSEKLIIYPYELYFLLWRYLLKRSLNIRNIRMVWGLQKWIMSKILVNAQYKIFSKGYVNYVFETNVEFWNSTVRMWDDVWRFSGKWYKSCKRNE